MILEREICWEGGPLIFVKVAFTEVVRFASAVEPADHGWIAMVEKERFACVQFGDVVHLIVGEGEVEDLEILLHTVATDRLGDDHYASLD